MHAVTIVDGTLTWQEHPDPEPGPDQLLVAVRAAGINAGDLLQRRGFYPAPPGSPADIPGLEAAGEVLAIGRNVRAFAPGMVARGRGSIVAFSSIRAVTVEPGQGVYAATKAGLVQLLRTAAAEFGPPGVMAAGPRSSGRPPRPGGSVCGRPGCRSRR